MTKFILLLVIVSSFQAFSKGYGQTAISLSLEHADLKKVFKEIEKRSGYHFLYNDENIGSPVPFDNLVFKNESISNVMSILLGKTNLKYQLGDDNSIIIYTDGSNARAVAIRGNVTDDTDKGLPGVSVRVKGTTIGTQTDLNGNYSLNVPDADIVLMFSFTGYETQEIPVNTRTVVNVKMKAQAKSIDEIVVVGYGVIKKSSLTGAVSKIDSKTLNTLPTSNAIDALQGKVAGVQIGAETTPGGTPSILIRGTRSISASNNPLYVVDGVPLSAGSTISDIAVTDIESIEVLKDAASTAIYGSRGANGVIMVTTKRGRPNQPIDVSFATYAGRNVPQIPKLMSGDQYIQFRRDAARANQSGGWAAGYPADATIFFPGEQKTISAGNFVDWQKLLFRNGFNQSYNASVSHGSDKSQVFFSLGYLDQQGYYKTNDNKRINLTLNADFNVTKSVKIGVSSRISNSATQGYNQNGALPLEYMNPLAQPFDATGNLILLPAEKNATIFNPLANYYFPYKNNTNTLRANNIVYADLSLIRGLKFRSNFSLNANRTSNDIFRGKNSYDQSGRASYGQQGQNNTNDMVWDNILSYVRDFGSHNINITAVSSRQSTTNTTSFGSGESFPIENISSWNLAAATANILLGSNYRRSTISSYLGRVQYAFRDKYILNGSFRADGSSVLAPGHQWGYFPSVSAAWVISREGFFKAEKIDNLKLRASYGTVGNSSVDAYSTLAQSSQAGYNFGNAYYYGYEIGNLSNPQLKWEYSTTANLGVEFTAFKNRLSGTLEFYRTKTKDLLLLRTLPTLSGFSSVYQNIGATSNRGIEIGLSSVNINSKNFRWNTDVNVYANKERIDKLITNADIVGNSLFIGKPVQVYYDFEKTGIWQTADAAEALKYQRVPGDIRMRDVNGDGVVEAVKDRVILGQVQPKINLFMRNSFTFRNINFAFAMESKIGNLVRSEALGLDLFYDGQRQAAASIAGHYWTPDNPTNDYPRVGPSQPLNYGLTGYRKGGYVNMQEISLGYSLKQLKIFRNFEIYARARNPFYVYRQDKNIDPQAPGFDISAFKSYVIGANVRL